MSESSQNSDSPMLAHSPAALISLKSVRKIYTDGNVEALRGVSLEIGEGEFVSVMGPSGCGKSTLLNLLGGIDRPTQGKVLYGGRELGSGAELDRFRSEVVGFVFQSFYLLPNLTALENVQIPMFGGKLPLSQRVERASELLQIVGLEARASHLPHQLSIGQRQRVAIARALANQPKLIMADEPTGSLDSQSGSEVLELLAHLNQTQGATLIVVTHDRKIARRAQRMIRMFDGRIVTDP